MKYILCTGELATLATAILFFFASSGRERLPTRDELDCCGNSFTLRLALEEDLRGLLARKSSSHQTQNFDVT